MYIKTVKKLAAYFLSQYYNITEMASFLSNYKSFPDQLQENYLKIALFLIETFEKILIHSFR